MTPANQIAAHYAARYDAQIMTIRAKSAYLGSNWGHRNEAWRKLRQAKTAEIVAGEPALSFNHRFVDLVA
jgi:hypothetical protein